MPTLYDYYDGNNYSLKLVNKTISTGKTTSIYLGDDTNRIYTKSANTISFTSNLIDIEKNLTIGSSNNTSQLTVYNKIGVNTPSVYSNISTHIKNSTTTSITSPIPTFDPKDLLLLENGTGVYLQLLANNVSTSGIGFSTTSNRNQATIEYTYSNSTLTFTSASGSSMSFATNTLSIQNITVTNNLSVSQTFTSNIIENNNVLKFNTSTVTGSGNLTANFTSVSIVVVKISNTTSTTISLNIPSIQGDTPSRMRIIYLLVKSNGNYSISSTNVNGSGGNIRFPSGFPITPSANGKYDMYSFLTNGQDSFCTFAYNYDYNTSGPLN